MEDKGALLRKPLQLFASFFNHRSSEKRVRLSCFAVRLLYCPWQIMACSRIFEHLKTAETGHLHIEQHQIGGRCCSSVSSASPDSSPTT